MTNHWSSRSREFLEVKDGAYESNNRSVGAQWTRHSFRI